MGNIKCPHCKYESDSWSVKRHIKRKHKNHLTTYNGNQQNESQLKTSYMQDYPQLQSAQEV